jgi:hypothetical protein
MSVHKTILAFSTLSKMKIDKFQIASTISKSYLHISGQKSRSSLINAYIPTYHVRANMQNTEKIVILKI